jgi:hypothetical protein
MKKGFELNDLELQQLKLNPFQIKALEKEIFSFLSPCEWVPWGRRTAEIALLNKKALNAQLWHEITKTNHVRYSKSELGRIFENIALIWFNFAELNHRKQLKKEISPDDLKVAHKRAQKATLNSLTKAEICATINLLRLPDPFLGVVMGTRELEGW